MNAPGHPYCCRTASLLAKQAAFWACAVLTLGLSAGGVGAQTVWELTPYRVQLIVAAQRTAGYGPDLEADLERALTGRLEAVVGASWDVSVRKPLPALGHLLISSIDDVTLEDLPKESLEVDKVMLLAISGAKGERRVSVRELTVRTQSFGTVVHVPVWQDAKLCDTAFRAVLKAFAPLAKIQEVGKDRSVILRLRSAGLPPRDASLTFVRPGDVFQPIVRYNDREGNARRVNPVPWTFLQVEEASPELVRCKLYTGLRSPLSGRRRGRVEQLAVAVIPPRRPTRLIVQSGKEPKRPLPDYEVYSRAPGSKETRLLGRTDWRGSIRVPPVDSALEILLIRNGGRLLAELPLVPGLPPRQTADVPDDDRRLEAEGFNTGLQEALIDLVVRREILLARARARIEAGKFKEADTLIDELRGLDTRAQFALALDRGKTRIFSEDRTEQRKIDALFGKTSKLLQKHLDPEIIDRVDLELSKARSSGSGKTP